MLRFKDVGQCHAKTEKTLGWPEGSGQNCGSGGQELSSGCTYPAVWPTSPLGDIPNRAGPRGLLPNRTPSQQTSPLFSRF